MTAMTNTDTTRTSEASLVSTLQLTYALHAVGLAIGAFGAATVIGSFIFGWPSIIAVIVNYVKRNDAGALTMTEWPCGTNLWSVG